MGLLLDLFALIAVIIVVLAAVGAWIFYTNPIEQPEIQGVSIMNITGITTQGCNIDYILKVYNPNIVGLTLTSVNYTLKLHSNGNVLSTGVSTQQFTVPAKGSVDIPIHASVYWGSTVSAIVRGILDKSVLVDLSGTAAVKVLWTSVNVDFAQTIDAYQYLHDFLGAFL